MATLLEPTDTEGKPAPCRGDSKKAGILAYIHHGQGICRTPKQGEAPRTFRARVYEALRRIKLAANPPRNVRIAVMYPTSDWERVWATLHATWAAGSIKVNWFKVIHDILPTNERLHAIRLAVSPLCSNCGEHDTIMHRIIECGEGRKIWEWTRNRIAWILRMDPVWIPNEWTIHPQFELWPPQRHRVVFWILAHMVWCRTRGGWTLSAQEYIDFLRRTPWKANRDTRRATQVGN
jgi:hypothetical protein